MSISMYQACVRRGLPVTGTAMTRISGILALFWLLPGAALTAGELLPTPGERAVHERLLVLDSHLDTPMHFGRAGWDIRQRHTFHDDLSQLDLPRMADGGLDGGFWVIYTPQGPLTAQGYAAARDFALLRGMNIRQTVAANADRMQLASTADDAARIAAAGRRVVFQSMENSYPVGEDLSLLATFHRLGVRMAGPVHSRNSQFADSCCEIPRWQGLSPLGRRWVGEMNRLGMLIDASHASEATFDQLLALSQAPIVLSHTGPKAIFDHPRNLDDARIRALAARGGVIQLNTVFLVAPDRDPAVRGIYDKIFNMEAMDQAGQAAVIAEATRMGLPPGSPTASFELFMQSLLHAIEVAGVDHVGIGADWDGGGGVPGLEDVADLPRITAALLRAGYSEADVAKIWSGNLLRVLAEAEAVAARLATAPVDTPATAAGEPPRADLTTVAERSGFGQTGRYEEVERLCAAYQARWPRQVRCFEFGRTPQGRPMLALAASADGMLSPQAARAASRPVALFQGGIHAGEIDGKDAGFLALREMLEGRELPRALSQVTWLFVPVFNVDGHERFGRWNRPNQRGPEEMGWRTTAQRLNLNRDYMKADAPEMRALLRLLQDWDPVLYVDLHVTDGARFRHDLSVQVEPALGWDAGLGMLGRALQATVLADLARQGFRPLSFYPEFVEHDRPESGFAAGVAPPRFSTSYWASRNRLAVLVETHSWKEYPRRVAATRAAILALTRQAADAGGRWLEAAREADARAAGLAGQPVTLAWRSGDGVRTIDFEGYAFVREPSAISGGDWIRYDEATAATWRLPMRDGVEAALTVDAPGAGYLVPAEHADWLGERLAVHGVRFERLATPLDAAAVQVFRADRVTHAAATQEGRVRTSVAGRWQAGHRNLGAGALFVPIDQPAARLLMGLLEPLAPDSLVAWGFFDNSFERKEYMEDYLAEEVARDMLAADAGLRDEFERTLAADAGFAASPAARLEFFARRHPSWDAELNLYPVLRLNERPAAGGP